MDNSPPRPSASAPSSPSAPPMGTQVHRDIYTQEDLIQAGNNQNVTSLTFHQGVKIGYWAFQNCAGLTSIVVHQGVTIEWGAFEGCTGLASIVIHQERTTIGWGAFKDCIGLESIVIGQGVKIGRGAFKDCIGLTSIVISQGVTIDVGAFYGCTGLTSIVLPQGVKIGKNAFSGCIGLRSMFILMEDGNIHTWRNTNTLKFPPGLTNFTYINNDIFSAITQRFQIPSGGPRDLRNHAYNFPTNFIEVLEHKFSIERGSPSLSISATYGQHYQLTSAESKRVKTSLLTWFLAYNRNNDATSGSYGFLPELPLELFWLILRDAFFKCGYSEPDFNTLLCRLLNYPS